MYSFLNFSLAGSPLYPTVLARLKTGNETLLDQGCCFGQDLRKLVFDGVPAENLVGSELEQTFIDLGYEVFNDRNKLKAKFYAGDFYTDIGLKEGSFDMINAGNFFHLFSWEGQVEAVSKCVRLLLKKEDSLILGQQICQDVAKAVKHPAAAQGEFFMHDLESFKKMVKVVAERTGVGMECGVERLPEKMQSKEVGGAWKMLRFVIRLC
jgi:hypothetical protein